MNPAFNIVCVLLFAASMKGQVQQGAVVIQFMVSADSLDLLNEIV